MSKLSFWMCYSEIPLAIPLLFTMGETHPKQTATQSLCLIKLPTFMPYALPVHIR